MALRRCLWAHGYRYRVHASSIAGRPDIAFIGVRVAIFVDGDFWHGNPREWRRRGRESLEDLFPSRAEWWAAKIRRNRERDLAVARQLRAEGWTVLRYWESAIKRDVNKVVQRIATVVGARRLTLLGASSQL
jgi:DNA mismatch endonuclease (patch repair protein)